MDLESFANIRSPRSLAEYLAGLPRQYEHPHDHMQSIRHDEFRGHEIKITTEYTIEVDGSPLSLHIGISNDGTAHCHGLPAYKFHSLVGLVKALIKYFPEDFDPNKNDGAAHSEIDHGLEHRKGN